MLCYICYVMLRSVMLCSVHEQRVVAPPEHLARTVPPHLLLNLLHGAAQHQVRLATAAALVEDDLGGAQSREQRAQAVLLRVVGALGEREGAGRAGPARACTP